VGIDSEQITYTGKSGNSLTGATRGANSTTAAAHSVAAEVNIPSQCGTQNICKPVNKAKGFDGLACTADDPLGSQGNAATIPTTTRTAASTIVDATNVAGQQIFGTQPLGNLAGNVCSGVSPCVTSLPGFKFNCTNLLAASPSVSGAGLASAFPQIDAATTQDNVVANRQRAKGACVGGTNVGKLCVTDLDCPSSTCK